MSRPFKAMGQPCAWMGVGARKPARRTSDWTYSGKEASSKVVTGRGTSLPSTTIWCSRWKAATSSGEREVTAGCSW